MVATHVQRGKVWRQQFFLALVLFGDELFQYLCFNLEQRRQRADVNDIFEQLALARIGVGSIDNFGQWYADDVDVISKLRLRHLPG